jgi:hypothetical protein
MSVAISAWVVSTGAAVLTARADLAATPGPSSGTTFYSTAEPPANYPGPTPVALVLALADLGPPQPSIPDLVPVEPPPAEPPISEPPASMPRLASVPLDRVPRPQPALAGPRAEGPSAAPAAEADPTVRAKRAIAECRARYQQVRDYTCTFLKRERIDGRLTAQHAMAMKVRAQPLSIYLKFQAPNAGREAIYVAGRHGGRALVHDVGLGKLIAGTLALDPRGSRAMDDCRHPITEAGIGHMIDQIAQRWEAEMTPGETRVVINPQVLVGKRPCTLIESTHPQRHPNYLFHQVKVYIDRELGLPIRFEAYDWPQAPGRPPELVEEYTYLNLRLNVGLRDHDFDTANPNYSFGRF